MPNPKPSRLVISGPSTSFRLTAADIRILNFGCYVLCFHAHDLSLRSSDFELWQGLMKVAERLRRLAADQKSATHRIHGDALAIAALQFGLRCLGRKAQPARIPFSWPENLKPTRLLQRLENFRKRALRSWLHSASAATYQQWRTRWLAFLKRIQVSLKPVPHESRRSYFQKTVDRTLTLTQAVLGEAGQWVPPDRDLRPLVRQALRHVRRGRGSISRRDLWNATPDARAFLLDFVGRLVTKLFWSRMRMMPEDPKSIAEEEGETFAKIMDAARDKAWAKAIKDGSWENRLAAKR